MPDHKTAIITGASRGIGVPVELEVIFEVAAQSESLAVP
jgi:short-subunit dehydrogenase